MINKERIKLLPVWNFLNTSPGFYDLDSKTAVGQSARLYGAMRELQDDYNKFANQVNEIIMTFINDINADQEQFIQEITTTVHDYLKMIDSKIEHQDRVIADNITYITENLKTSLTEILEEMNEQGELDESILNAFNGLNARVSTLEKTEYISTYNETTKSLTLQKIIKA